MTVQIDDAGWGSLIEGALIGACRVESPRTQHAFKMIPVGFFQGEAFATKAYLGQAAICAVELMDQLKVAKEEPIQICTGYVLGKAYETLAGLGYQISRGKIRAPLQDLIENEFYDRIMALGVETDFETMTTRQGLYFYHCLQWLKKGDVDGQADPQRAAFCKTGWSSYSSWASLPYQLAKKEAKAVKAAKRRARWQRW